MRVLGLAMLVYGAGMFALLYTPYKDWALNHSIASAVAVSDKRVGNTIDTAVDMPMAIAGSAVMVFAGLWFALFVPWVLNRWTRQQRAAAGYDEAPTERSPTDHQSGTASAP